MSDVVRVLIADDHPVVRSGIRGMLASDPRFEVVAEASDGTEAVALALRERPDVVLMDLRMPELDSASATAEIRAKRPKTQVLVLTTYDTDSDIVRAIDAARSATCSKTFLTKRSPGPCTLRPAVSRYSLPRSPSGSWTALVALRAMPSPTARSTCSNSPHGA
jgi:CheY-like chemotaxis protein